MNSTTQPSTRTRWARTLHRDPPFHLELERAVLAVLLDGRHAGAVGRVRTLIPDPQAFWHRDHRCVYRACLDLHAAGEAVDALAVAALLMRTSWHALCDRLAEPPTAADPAPPRQPSFLETSATGYDDSALAAIGGHTAVADLAASYAPASALERNAELVWDYHLKRQLITRLQALVDTAHRTPLRCDALLREGLRTILGLGRQAIAPEPPQVGASLPDTAVAERADDRERTCVDGCLPSAPQVRAAVG